MNQTYCVYLCLLFGPKFHFRQDWCNPFLTSDVAVFEPQVLWSFVEKLEHFWKSYLQLYNCFSKIMKFIFGWLAVI